MYSVSTDRELALALTLKKMNLGDPPPPLKPLQGILIQTRRYTDFPSIYTMMIHFSPIGSKVLQGASQSELQEQHAIFDDPPPMI